MVEGLDVSASVFNIQFEMGFNISRTVLIIPRLLCRFLRMMLCWFGLETARRAHPPSCTSHSTRRRRPQTLEVPIHIEESGIKYSSSCGFHIARFLSSPDRVLGAQLYTTTLVCTLFNTSASANIEIPDIQLSQYLSGIYRAVVFCFHQRSLLLRKWLDVVEKQQFSVNAHVFDIRSSSHARL